MVTEALKMTVLDVEALWRTATPHSLFEAKQIVGKPTFYPLYRAGNLYSFSPFPLITHKGYLRIDSEVARYLETTKGDISPPGMFIDQDIERVGGEADFESRISTSQAFYEAMATALQADITEIEAANPGTTNVILCGGKDSLNLLLLSWANPTIVYSAQPNYPLVRKFVADNKLPFEVFELSPRTDAELQIREIAEACGMVSLANWRWTAHLKAIAEEFSGRAIFWKGQVADALLTDYWRSYTSNYSRYYRLARKAYKRVARHSPSWLTALPDRIVMRDLRRSLWERAAVGQGAHMGMLRSITGCLFLSAYHGPRTTNVMLSGNYNRLAKVGDLRPGIGATLLGRKVNYPSSNPAPGELSGRANLRTLNALVEAYRSFGVPVRSGK